MLGGVAPIDGRLFRQVVKFCIDPLNRVKCSRDNINRTGPVRLGMALPNEQTNSTFIEE
jgi:hypothetical protein